MSTFEQPAAPPTSAWRTFRFPIIVLVLCGLVLTLPYVCVLLDVQTEAAMPVFMLVQLAIVGSVLLISLWWLFFSGLRWSTRFLGVLLVGLVATGFYFSISKLEFTTARVGGLIPTMRFVWQASPEADLEQHLQAQPAKADDLPSIDATVGPADFAQYRGPHGDGAVPGAKLAADWSQASPKVLWTHPCVEGYSGIAVAGNIAVTIDHRDNAEAVVCFDRATGRQRWAFKWDAQYRDVMGSGPRSTPTIHAGRVFALGAKGDLVCLNAQGEKQWAVNVLTDAGAKNIKWGLTGSPLIVDDLVVVHAGIDPEAPADRSLIAYDQKTGSRRWAAGKRRASYSSPVLATLGGMRQIVIFAGDGLVGCNPEDGKELWFHEWNTKFDMNMIQPLFFAGDRVFISSEAENGCAMLHVQPPASDGGAWSVKPAWKSRALGSRFANPVTDGKRIWGLHGMDGVFTCVDADTGKRLWQGERFGPGQLLLAGSHLIVVNEDGAVFLFDADGKEPQEHGRFAVFGSKTWNTPALAGDQLFIRNQTRLACVRLPHR